MMDQAMIDFRDVSFSYPTSGEPAHPAIDKISLSIPQGQHCAILGHNGSGKSTLARLCNALELPDKGSVAVLGRVPNSVEDIFAIRKSCGMVFQNPDNQIVGTTVEEDVAFGPENLGLPSAEIRQRVDEALKRVGLENMAQRSPSRLSGGQKQKLGIAGALAMRPSCLILDEACAMLDPLASDEFMAFADQLCRKNGLTLLQITHDMDQAQLADRVIVLSHGKLIMDGTPAEVFSHQNELEREGLRAPTALRVLHGLFPDELLRSGDRPILTQEDCCAFLAERLRGREFIYPERPQRRGKDAEKLIQVEHLSFAYERADGSRIMALKDINFEVRRGEIFVLCGHSGSGKSTLITHLNGLFQPLEGKVSVMGLDSRDKKNLSEIRRHSGLVFQYPEHQLFEATVAEDVAYGPKKQGLSASEVQKRVRAALELVSLGPEFMSRSPFELSGGQKRRVAIAGILAMDPDILVLDEPAAGLDPRSREEMLSYIERLRDEGKTIVMVTHNMDDAARLADYMAVLSEGEIKALAAPEQIFADSELLRSSGLKKPSVLEFSDKLNKALGSHFAFYSLAEAIQTLRLNLKAERGDLHV